MKEKWDEKIKIGTSGWHYDHWKDVFYPAGMSAKNFFSFYKTQFNTVELNNTFYMLPKEKTFINWKESAPDFFEFSLKGSRYITHVKKLNDTEKGLSNFFSGAKILGNKVGVILFQLPPNLNYNEERLDKFLKSLEKYSEYKFAFEFRNKEWINNEVKEKLMSRNISFCIYNMGEYTTPLWETADIIYIRLHGQGGAYWGNYHGNSLRIWARRIVKWANEGKKIYCYFNNDVKGFAPKNANTLKEKIKESI